MRQTGRMLGMDFYSPGLKAWKRGSLELVRLGLFLSRGSLGGRVGGFGNGWNRAKHDYFVPSRT